MIRQALFAMAFGALGAVALQGVIWLTVPQPPRFAQVDLVAIMETEIAGMARQRIGGTEVDPQSRAARIQDAVAVVAAESGRTILARQALIAGPMAEVPDLTDEVRRRLR
jgi:hypothetical protein